MYERHRSRSQSPPRRQRPERFKRPLVILTYCDDQLQSIHSSTPSVQFVRLDRSGDPATAETSVTHPAREVIPLALTELALDLRQTAQRAFRRSASR